MVGWLFPPKICFRWENMGEIHHLWGVQWENHGKIPVHGGGSMGKSSINVYECWFQQPEWVYHHSVHIEILANTFRYGLL